MRRIFGMTTLASILAVAALPPWAQGQSAPKYAAKGPPAIQTPDTVQPRIGTLAGSRGLSKR
jgi:hypothetical protein